MSEESKRGIKVCVEVPPKSGPTVFRTGVADDVVRQLADAPGTEFTIAELVDITGAARSTVWRAVDLLDEVGAVRVRETPQRKYVAVDTERLLTDDPLLAIPQPEFHEPIRAFVDRVETEIAEADDVDELLSVVVFGSVARGEADRRSDIDLFVVVDGDRTTARRLVTGVVDSLADRRFDGDRFAFEPYVETEESASRAGSKLQEIFEEGITVYGQDRLQSVRTAVFADE